MEAGALTDGEQGMKAAQRLDELVIAQVLREHANVRQLTQPDRAWRPNNDAFMVIQYCQTRAAHRATA